MSVHVCAMTLLFTVAVADAAPAVGGWRALGNGVEYGEWKATAAVGFQVVRVDPARARLRAVMASAVDKKPRTAAKWCDSQHLLAAINLGMYLDDHLSNVGHAHSGAHVNQSRWVGKYQSALAFGPRKPGLATAALLDLDTPGARGSLADYDTVIQNLRLVRAPGHNAWGPQNRRWSEAAVAIDRRGRVLFVFARAPLSMFEFNRQLLALPLEVVSAMHVEGGPEASLSVRGGLSLDFNGSYETGFNENESVAAQWEIPNVLGVEPLPGAN